MSESDLMIHVSFVFCGQISAALEEKAADPPQVRAFNLNSYSGEDGPPSRIRPLIMNPVRICS